MFRPWVLGPILAATACSSPILEADYEPLPPPGALLFRGALPEHPDGSRVRARYHLLRPSRAPGGRIEEEYCTWPGLALEVQGGRYEGRLAIDFPGIYILDLLPESGQEPLASIHIPCWDDHLAAELTSALREIQELSTEVESNVTNWERLSDDNDTFRKGAAALFKASTALLWRIRKHPALRLYPASAMELDCHLNNLIGNHKNLNFERAGFNGAQNFGAGTPLRTLRDEPPTFDNYRRYIREVPSLAAREFGLWIVKDMRRRGDGKIRPEFEAFLKLPPKPIEPWASRLLAARPATLDALEAELRAPSP